MALEAALKSCDKEGRLRRPKNFKEILDFWHHYSNDPAGIKYDYIKKQCTLFHYLYSRLLRPFSIQPFASCLLTSSTLHPCGEWHFISLSLLTNDCYLGTCGEEKIFRCDNRKSFTVVCCSCAKMVYTRSKGCWSDEEGVKECKSERGGINAN